MFEPVNAFGELVVYPAIVGILLEFILIDDFLGNYAELVSRILWSIEGSVEVEVGEVRCHILGPRCGEGAVDNQLDRFEGPRLGTTITGVVDGIATDGDAGLVFVGRTLQTTRVCATSLRRLMGMSWNSMGFIVIVPVTHCVLGMAG